MSRRKKAIAEPAEAAMKFTNPLDRLYELYGPPRTDPIPQPEFIYVTRAPFGCKIGRTIRPELRPLQVAGNAPVQLDALIVREVAGSRDIEKRLHDHYQGKWLRGEWFSLDDADIEFIRDLLDGKVSFPEVEEDFEDIPF
jgi:hypothetical protein